MDAQFYNQLQFFGSWSVMIICALWITGEVWLLAKFVKGRRTWFFRWVIILLLFYSFYNGLLIYLAVNESVGWAKTTIQDFNSVQLQRMYSHTLFPFCTALLLRTLNSRVMRVSQEEKIIILDAKRILARTRRECERAEQVEKRINETLRTDK